MGEEGRRGSCGCGCDCGLVMDGARWGGGGMEMWLIDAVVDGELWVMDGKVDCTLTADC